MPEQGDWVVVVPVRSEQTFVVSAASPAAAKRKVNLWMQGKMDDGPDINPLDDIGQVVFPLGVRYWTVERSKASDNGRGDERRPSGLSDLSAAEPNRTSLANEAPHTVSPSEEADHG